MSLRNHSVFIKDIKYSQYPGIDFFSLLHISFFSTCIRRKYLNRENVLLPFLHGATLLEYRLTRFDYFGKKTVCMCVCHKIFIAALSQEIMHGI